LGNRVDTVLRRLAVAVPSATLQSHWESGVARRAIHEGRWDYVVLQEQSVLPLQHKERMHEYVRLFDREIKQSGAKTVLFTTWARRDKPETQAALNTAYGAIAEELGALAAPVGSAWQIARQGAPGVQLYDEDGSHPTAIGSYLSACVLYLVIQGSESRCPALKIEGLASDIDTLRSAADSAVAKSR
jgi:hypothetical protein